MCERGVWEVEGEVIVNLLIQYGIAGIVIYLLFRIVFNDLASIKLELRDIKLSTPCNGFMRTGDPTIDGQSVVDFQLHVMDSD